MIDEETVLRQRIDTVDPADAMYDLAEGDEFDFDDSFVSIDESELLDEWLVVFESREEFAPAIDAIRKAIDLDEEGRDPQGSMRLWKFAEKQALMLGFGGGEESPESTCRKSANQTAASLAATRNEA